jgi:hypothetical protein
VIQDEILNRLNALGLNTLRLPLSAGPTDPHVRILASPPEILRTASRVVVVFGEPTQDLGTLAGRVVTGPGGIDKGSMVSVARRVLAQHASAADARPPALVLANTGEGFWWPEGGRALAPLARHGSPRSSAVSLGAWFDERVNGIPGSGNADEHVASVFRDVLGKRCTADGAELSIVALGGAAEAVERFLAQERNWAAWGERMQSLALLGGFFGKDEILASGFRDFLRDVRALATLLPCVI